MNNLAPTIRAEMGDNLTSVIYPAAFMGGQGAKARSIAYCDDGTTPTLKSVMSGGNTVPDVVYPNSMKLGDYDAEQSQVPEPVGPAEQKTVQR